MKILVMGAAGSGTSTLAAALADTLKFAHVEADEYYWESTSPPFKLKRESGERLSGITTKLAGLPDAVVAGSILDWGDELENCFDLIVFLYLAADVRVARIAQREFERYGKVDETFLSWAGQYDEGTLSGRSLTRHQNWLVRRNCKVLRLEGDFSINDKVRLVLNAINANQVIVCKDSSKLNKAES